MEKNTIIKVENLSKRYLLNKNRSPKSDTLYGTFAAQLKNLKNLTQKKETEEFWALRDVTFDIKEGDRVGIIGRNGAGKSTLLKILSRITPPTGGRIELFGRVASLLEVGTGFHGDLSGRENIYLNGSILGMSKTEINRKFDEIIAFAEIEKFLDTPVKRYSSGMYVRLAFAVAAHLEPDILIVDEVLAVGDAEFQKKCLGKMKDVSDSGRTILFVSHQMEAIQKLCNRSILLHKGSLIKSGETNEVVKYYLDSAASGASTFDIPLPENFESLNGYATQAIIEDTSGNKISEIPIGRGWQVRVLFTLNKDLPAFVIGIGIVTMMDLAFRTTWSEAKSSSKGKYEAVFVFDDIMLASGNYKILIGLSQHEVTFHYVDNLVNIVISDVSDLINDKRIVNSKSGLILNQSKVEISKL